MEKATHGPAHLDCDGGVAHKDPECSRLTSETVISTAVACEGPMTGFIWCDLCKSQPFTVGCGDGCECLK